MAKISDLEIEIKPKFIIDGDTAYQCLTLLEMYCNSNNNVVSWYRSKDSSDEWRINLEFDELNAVLKKHEADIHGNEFTNKEVVNTCKKYDSEYVDGETALSVGYIFGRLIPLIEESKGEQKGETE